MPRDKLSIVINFRMTEEMHTRLEAYKEKADAKSPYNSVTATDVMREAIGLFLDAHEEDN